MDGVKVKGGGLGFEARLGACGRIDQRDFMSTLNQGPGQIDDMAAGAAAGRFYDQ